ncbi:MAG: hypothetical protein B7Y34_04835 [Methylophilales bacterium 16-45-9]|nr:MAG: hypothetical protein B7Y34_04835 [Methylophilales bacterium 16-45-9]
MKKVAIIGAGLSGLTLAQQIVDIAEVTIFEKFHQVSGRMAAREHLPFVFDHGAQFFTVKYPEFADVIHHLKEANVVDSWEARFVEVDGTLSSLCWGTRYGSRWHVFISTTFTTAGRHTPKQTRHRYASTRQSMVLNNGK